jgi:hypothetical protein
LVEFGARVESLQPQPFEQTANKGGADYSTEHRRPEALGQQPGAHAKIGAHEEEPAMGQIDDAQQPESEAQSEREQEQEHAVDESVETLNDDEFQHRCSLQARALPLRAEAR